jgi:hypothetical protein
MCSKVSPFECGDGQPNDHKCKPKSQIGIDEDQHHEEDQDHDLEDENFNKE